MVLTQFTFEGEGLLSVICDSSMVHFCWLPLSLSKTAEMQVIHGKVPYSHPHNPYPPYSHPYLTVKDMPQNHTTRVITKSRCDTNRRPLLNSLAWDPFCQKGEAKGISKLAPGYLSDMFEDICVL